VGGIEHLLKFLGHDLRAVVDGKNDVRDASGSQCCDLMLDHGLVGKLDEGFGESQGLDRKRGNGQTRGRYQRAQASAEASNENESCALLAVLLDKQENVHFMLPFILDGYCWLDTPVLRTREGGKAKSGGRNGDVCEAQLGQLVVPQTTAIKWEVAIGRGGRSDMSRVGTREKEQKSDCPDVRYNWKCSNRGRHDCKEMIKRRSPQVEGNVYGDYLCCVKARVGDLRVL